jgi:hypothetical protein
MSLVRSEHVTVPFLLMNVLIEPNIHMATQTEESITINHCS